MSGPYITEQDLRDDPVRFLRADPKEIARVITVFTSGSTDRPKRLFFTEEDLLATADFWTEGMKPMVRPGDLCPVFMTGPGKWTVAGLLALANERLGVYTECCGYVTEPEAAAARLREMAAAGRPLCPVGLPGQMLALARLTPGLQGIRSVLLSGDLIPEGTREELEAAWGAEVFAHWGMTETGYGGAVEDAAHDGYRIREDLELKIVDPLTLEELPAGAWGEIVISTPKRRGMPLLGYRTGDRSRILPNGKLDTVSRIRPAEKNTKNLT